MMIKIKKLLKLSNKNFSLTVPASAVKKLRLATGAPLMQCKKALETKDGNL